MLSSQHFGPAHQELGCRCGGAQRIQLLPLKFLGTASHTKTVRNRRNECGEAFPFLPGNGSRLAGFPLHEVRILRGGTSDEKAACTGHRPVEGARWCDHIARFRSTITRSSLMVPVSHHSAFPAVAGGSTACAAHMGRRLDPDAPGCCALEGVRR